MKKTGPRVSIVIPAYNEEEHLRACLEAIYNQSVMPYEVIVADNNSTDGTLDIVDSFPLVKVVKVAKQGVVYARDAGFNLASGDIIGRIDADTILPRDWIAKVNEIFDDQSIMAVSGSLHFYDIGWSKVVDSVESYWRNWMAEKMAVHERIFLLGANMAIRRSAWENVKYSLCHSKRLHEDLDLALHLSEDGLRVAYNACLKANVSARRIDSSFLSLWKYTRISPDTYQEHDARDYVYMYPIIAIVLANYFILRFLYRAYDDRAGRFNLKLLFSKTQTRINPVTLAKT
jgi:glycosyltransferase involved in cell wall biosynthesis